MKIAIITDTHYGIRKGSKYFHDYFELFYKNVFFPYLEENKVDIVVHMGDAFDSRKSIDYQSLEWAKRVVFDPLSDYETHMIIGNHDCYYKNTNNVNSPELLLVDYKNIKTYSSSKTVNIGGLDILMLPWICSENYKKSLQEIKKTKAKIVMGHLELNGFRATRGHMMEDGMESNIFNKFDKVFSGHFHTRSDDGKIFYLGNPYELFWNDVNDDRGFHIFDTETLTHTLINNPYNLFCNVYYDDTPYQMIKVSDYKDKIVKVIVKKKSNQKKFDKFLDKLYNSGAYEIKIVENFQVFPENDDFVVDDDDNTINILNRYIDESEVNFDKGQVKKIFEKLYREVYEVE